MAASLSVEDWTRWLRNVCYVIVCAVKEQVKPAEERNKADHDKVDELRGTPLAVGTLEEIIDENHAIVSTSVGPEYYVGVLQLVDKTQLEPGCSVLLHSKAMAIVGILSNDADPMVSVMKVDQAPTESFADIGGLEAQIQVCVLPPLSFCRTPGIACQEPFEVADTSLSCITRSDESSQSCCSLHIIATPSKAEFIAKMCLVTGQHDLVARGIELTVCMKLCPATSRLITCRSGCIISCISPQG